MPEHQTETKLLEVVGLYAGYGVAPVLHGLDFALASSAMACILGRNGVGKTTLLRSIVGQLAVQQGDIRIDGASMVTLAAHARARAGIAYVPQGRDIFPSLSVQDNLKAAAFGMARADWRQALEAQFDAFPILREKAHARGASLSGGQQQILALARALMMRPRLLLLDEPSEGIQPSIVAQIAETIQDIHQNQGIAVVVVEQNLDFIARVGAPCHIMDRGRMVHNCPSEQIVQDRALQAQYLGV